MMFNTGHEIGAEPVRPSRGVVRGADADASSEPKPPRD